MKTPFLKLLILLSFSVLLFSVTVTAQWGGTKKRKIKSMPVVALPSEAEQAGLYGKVIALVVVNPAGKVIEVKAVSGPDGICNGYWNDALALLHSYVRDRAKEVEFEPLENGKTKNTEQYLQLDFPQSKAEADKAETIKAILDDKKNKNVVHGKPITMGRPEMRQTGARAVIHGTVRVEFEVDEEGRVFRARLDGPGLISVLNNSALSAACRSRFTQTTVNGKPVRVGGVVNYNF